MRDNRAATIIVENKAARRNRIRILKKGGRRRNRIRSKNEPRGGTV